VTKAYENKIAVNDLSLSIDAGQMLACSVRMEPARPAPSA